LNRCTVEAALICDASECDEARQGKMKTLEDLKNRTPHDDILEGNNVSNMVVAYFPKADLEKLLPSAMSIPSDEIMAEKYPTAKQIEGMHPFTMMFSNCHNVHDVMTEWELRSYREHFPLFPVIYKQGNEERLCSYIPVMYLDYLLGVVGGLYLGLRKQFHPGMKDIETGTTKSFLIKDTLDVKFEKNPDSDGRELDAFFVQTFAVPAVTISYLGQTWFYSTSVEPKKVLDTSHEFEWSYKGSVIKSSEDTFANYSEYRFTTSQAMRYDAYFHPAYALEKELAPSQ
jgi:hypothetical protein